MEKKYIDDGNKLIAELLGWWEEEKGTWYKKTDCSVIIAYSIHNNYPHNNLPFHRSWDWFVPAFNKIQKIKHDMEFCDLILAYIRHNDHENAFKCLVNYINIVIHNKPIKSPLIEAAKGLQKHLKK